MANTGRNRPQQGRTEAKEHIIYVLLFCDTLEFFVSFTSQADLSCVYKDHYNGRVQWTSSLFETYKSEDKRPDMMLLDTVTAPRNQAFFYMVCWARLLMETGWMCVNTSRGQAFQWHLEHFTEEMEQYYNQIKDTDLDALLAPERSLFPNYGRRSRQRSNGAGEKSRHNVTISLDAEQYRAVTDGAAFCGIKLSLYCKRRILDEAKLVINLPQYMPILYQMEEVCEELQALVYLVYRENGFDPVKGADEKRLEDAIAMMQKVQQSMGEEFLRLCRVIERVRYEKTADVRASYVRVNAAERRYLCELLTEKETFLQRERLEKETDLMLASEEAEGFPVLQEDAPILMELATCGRLLKRMETKQAENESPDITQE